MTAIAILASPGTFLASLGAMIDAHSRLGEAFAANPALGDYARMQTAIALVAAQGGPVLLAGGRRMAPDMPLHGLKDVGVAYLPSFQVPDPDRLEEMLEPAAPLHRWLRERHDDGMLIGACGASVCHLAAAGLLDGRDAAVHPRLVTSARRLFPRVAIDPLSALVVTGQVATCGPDIAAMRLVSHLIAGAFGPAVARNLSHREPATLETAAGTSTDPLVAEAKLWMHERFARDIRISDLADVLGVSHQTLLRRFHAAGEGSPHIYVQKVRADSAAVMLTQTRRPIAEIAQLVGYRDVASFRHMFQQRRGMTPGQYRRRGGEG